MAMRCEGMRIRPQRQSSRKSNSCSKFMKLLLVLLASLLLTNVLLSFTYGNHTLSNKLRSIWSMMSPLKFFGQLRLQHLHPECRRISSSFQGALNRTLIAYSSKHDDRLMRQVQQFLDGKFGYLFDSRLHKTRYSRYKARFRRGLKVLQMNLHMSYEPHILLDLLTKVKEPMDNHYKRLNYSNLLPGERYRTCAVVGNSGELLNTTRGSFIDSHDMVIRINNAKAGAFEPSLTDFTGSKTTLMFMNSHILRQCSKNRKCFCHPYGLHVPIMLYLCNSEHMLDVTYCASEHQSPLFLTDGRFDLLVARIARWYSIKRFFNKNQARSEMEVWWLLSEWDRLHRNDYHYSSGLQAVVLALGLCKTVNLFGFGKNPKFRHHILTSHQIEHFGHDYEAEYLFYHDLEMKRLDANPFLCETASYIPPIQIFHSGRDIMKREPSLRLASTDDPV